jgi:TM2 domain-containing membrane protein YozV
MSHPDPRREPGGDPPTAPLPQAPPHGQSAYDQPTAYNQPAAYHQPAAYERPRHHPVLDAAPVPPPYPLVPVGPSAVYAIPVAPRKSVKVAIALEIVLGLVGVFGVGCVYAGRVGLGLALMVSFWMLFWVNIVLVVILIGLLTMPLTWIAYVAVSTLLAVRAVKQHNSEALYR